MSSVWMCGITKHSKEDTEPRRLLPELVVSELCFRNLNKLCLTTSAQYTNYEIIATKKREREKKNPYIQCGYLGRGTRKSSDPLKPIFWESEIQF